MFVRMYVCICVCMMDRKCENLLYNALLLELLYDRIFRFGLVVSM